PPGPPDPARARPRSGQREPHAGSRADRARDVGLAYTAPQPPASGRRRAPCRMAATRSAGWGDQPRTVAIPARFAWRASEPPIAPRPMTPSVWGRTGWKLAPPHGRVNDEGGPAASPPRDGRRPPVLTAGAASCPSPRRPASERGSAATASSATR